MADTVYRVLTVYEADTKSAKSEVSSLAGVADHALKLLERGKEMIGSVIELHAEAQNATIAIAGLMSAGDYPGAKNFQTSMAMSAEIIKQMRKDARDLPGEFEDLQSIFQFSLLGGAQAGQSVNGVESMAAKLMAVTKSLGIASEFAGREFAELMEGRASSRVTLFAKLKNMMGEGMDATKFNALAAPEKWAKIQQALSSFGPMIAEYGKGWDAVSSTATDYLKNIIRIGSNGVFDTLQSTLQSLNVWYEKNEKAILGVSTAVFDGLGGALSYVFGLVGTSAPFVWAFFQGLYDVGVGVFGTLREAGTMLGEMFDGVFGTSLSVSTDNMHDLGEVIGYVATVMAGIVAAIGIVTAAQWAWNVAMDANPIALISAAVVGLGAAILLVVSYWDDMMDRIGELANNRVAIWMMKSAGVIPQNASDQDIQDSLNGGQRNHAQHNAALDGSYGNHGVMAHVKETAERAGLYAGKVAGSDPMYGPENQSQSAVAKFLDMQRKASEKKSDMNVHVRIEQTISDAENPRRVLDMTKRAVRESLERPTREFVAGVYR